MMAMQGGAGDRDGGVAVLPHLAATPAREQTIESSCREARTCLAEAGVRFAFLRDDPDDLGERRDLDILVHPHDRALATAALARAGFLPKRDRRLRGKTVFLRFVADRWLVLDVHYACVQNGIEYMSARGALSRLDHAGGSPRLCAEDRFLHLLLHNLLGKPALQAKHAGPLRALHAAGLDARRLDDQVRLFGLRRILSEALQHIDALEDPRTWRRLRRHARLALFCRPANLAGVWRYRHGDRLRWRRRPVVLALLGPDGSGKTSFADALEALLRDSPLRAGRVYMGCWGHDLLPMRRVRRLIPPQASYLRMLAHRCGLPLGLTAEERRLLEAEPHPRSELAWASCRYALKNALFHLALAAELLYRYIRHVALSRRPLVITDRYVYDLEFRQGKVPFAHGSHARRLLYGLFPAPDGILYLTTPYDLVASRKPQLDREQFETMDRIFRSVLRPYHPLALASDAPPDAMAASFLARHWEHLLERCNRRA
jgi:thymidylate kinase